MEKRVDIPLGDQSSIATFLDRPNRFLVRLIPEKTNQVEEAFLHDPGRLLKLLKPNVKLLIRRPPFKKGRKVKRKTNWDVLAVKQDEKWIVINSSFPNLVTKIAIENDWIPELAGYPVMKPEFNFGDSRLDFFLSKGNNQPCLVEVKGVTLVKENKALFPDAPTARGARHLVELIRSIQKGYRAVILFLVMREDPIIFSPNVEIDLLFAEQLVAAVNAGVEILVYKMQPVLNDGYFSLYLRKPLAIDLSL
ncbi:MAG: DNA/RNA nuclease SfsA [Candidatus Hodarchaeales archaeon]|jgi:sugar fermentation stimulation protein A